MTHYVCKLHAKYVNEFIVKLHCFIVLSWQGITNEVTAFQKCVVFSNFPFFSTVLLHKSEGCESKVKGCESISRYGNGLILLPRPWCGGEALRNVDNKSSLLKEFDSCYNKNKMLPRLLFTFTGELERFRDGLMELIRALIVELINKLVIRF